MTTWMRMNAVDGREPLIIQGSAKLADPASDPEIQARVLRAFSKLNDVPVYRIETYAADILAGKFTLQVEEERA